MFLNQQTRGSCGIAKCSSGPFEAPFPLFARPKTLSWPLGVLAGVSSAPREKAANCANTPNSYKPPHTTIINHISYEPLKTLKGGRILVPSMSLLSRFTHVLLFRKFPCSSQNLAGLSRPTDSTGLAIFVVPMILGDQLVN